MATNGSTVNGLKLVNFGGLTQVQAANLQSNSVFPLVQNGAAYNITAGNISSYVANTIPGANVPTSPLLGGSANQFTEITPDGITIHIINNSLAAVTNVAYGLAKLDQYGHFPLPNGPTINRPSPVNIGTQYLDTDLGYIVVWNGTVWINAAGGPA